MTNTSITEESNLILAYHCVYINDARSICPTLDSVLAQLREHGASCSTGTGLLVNTENLKGLNVDTIGRCALVLALPDMFKPLLPKLLHACPIMVSEYSLDLKQTIPVLRWSLEENINVLVDLIDVNSAIGRCSPQYWETDTRVRVPVPIVMLAGNSIGLGGIVTSPNWKQDVLDLERYTKHQHPSDILDEKTRQAHIELAQLVGPRPWSGRLWGTGKGSSTIQIPIHIKS